MMKVIRDTRLDELGEQQFRRMLESDQFQLFFDRVRAERDRQVVRLKGADNLVELRRAQGAAAALESVLDTPKLILDELRKSHARTNKTP